MVGGARARLEPARDDRDHHPQRDYGYPGETEIDVVRAGRYCLPKVAGYRRAGQSAGLAQRGAHGIHLMRQRAL
jgi:hypothetical protein